MGKCRFHRLHTHILRGKDDGVSDGMMAALMTAIVGGIYLDSNLRRESEAVHIKNVLGFCERFLPEVMLREDIADVARILKSHHRRSHHRRRSRKRNDSKRVDLRRDSV